MIGGRGPSRSPVGFGATPQDFFVSTQGIIFVKQFSYWNQKAARIVPLFLVVLIGFQLARGTWLLMPQPPMVPQVDIPTTTVEVPSVPSVPTLSPSAMLTALSHFNPWEHPLKKKVAAPPSVVPPPPKKEEEKAVETKLALDLIGTMVLPDDASWAILQRRTGTKEQVILRVGYEVDDAFLERIERRTVFVRNHGRLERLSMVNYDLPDQADGKQERPGHKHLSRARFNQLVAKGMSVLSGVKMTPFYQGAKSVGYRLTFSENHEEMRQLGLMDGDIIQKVNGMRVMDRKKLAQFASSLKRQSSLKIELLRQDRRETIHLSIAP